MKIILSVLILIFLKVNCFGQETIHWYTWEDAVELQKESPRKIFIDIYTSWCGWCKKMNASTFKDSTVVSVMNKYYYAVKFDAEQKDTLMFDGHAFVNVNPASSKGTHTFASTLLNNNMSYPSYVILNEQFGRMTIIQGYKEPDPLLGSLLFFGTSAYDSFMGYQHQMQQILQQQNQNK
ncbi:MAG TPA: thioredoxin [Flavobacteriales bacterium]|jgi:thioredoxin-related protein|nr:thioredoxin [Flavobacteriales bacterium]